MIDSALRAKAKEIAEQFHSIESSRPDLTLQRLITEALSLAYKQGALARVTRPSEDDIKKECTKYFDYLAAKSAIHWYRDSLKLTPLNAEDILPNKEYFKEWYSSSEEQLHCYDWLSDFVAAKLDLSQNVDKNDTSPSCVDKSHEMRHICVEAILPSADEFCAMASNYAKTSGEYMTEFIAFDLIRDFVRKKLEGK